MISIIVKSVVASLNIIAVTAITVVVGVAIVVIVVATLVVAPIAMVLQWCKTSVCERR